MRLTETAGGSCTQVGDPWGSFILNFFSFSQSVAFACSLTLLVFQPRELLKPSSSVALHRHSNALVDILPPEADSSISLLGENEKPNVTYQVGSARPFVCVWGGVNQ